MSVSKTTDRLTMFGIKSFFICTAILFAGCGSKENKANTNLVSHKREAEQKAKWEAEQKRKHAQAISAVLEKADACSSKDIADKFRKICEISLAGCPVDFCEAFYNYKFELKNTIDLKNEIEKYVQRANSSEAVAVSILEGFAGGMAGDPTYGYNQAVKRHNDAKAYFERRAEKVVNDLKKSFQECLRIANSYGVDVGRYY